MVNVKGNEGEIILETQENKLRGVIRSLSVSIIFIISISSSSTKKIILIVILPVIL